jgi:hypothetical protein
MLQNSDLAPYLNLKNICGYCWTTGRLANKYLRFKIVLSFGVIVMNTQDFGYLQLHA